MKNFIICCIFCLFLLTSCAVNTPEVEQTEDNTIQHAEIIEKEELPIVEIEPTEAEIIEQIISDMTLEEKIGQLFMVAYRKDANGQDILVVSEDISAQIEQYNLGGVILFSENLHTLEQTQTFTSDLQNSAKIPLFISIDEEGGTVSRLAYSEIEYEKFPSAGKITSAQEVERSATVIGETLIELGINVNFAPVADVNTNPSNTVIGNRAYSSDAEIASDMVSIFVNAIEKTGVSSVAKHFPGHGDTNEDSHYGTATVTHNLEHLQTVEFLPFQSAIESDVDFIMVGHITTPNITENDLPATLNPEIIDILRQDLGYTGVVIADAFDMQAITKNFGTEQSVIMAINAGIDIVLMPNDIVLAYNAVLNAVETEEISIDTINQHVTRIMTLKMQKGLI